MEYAKITAIALLSITLISCQESVVKYVEPIDLSSNPTSISLQGEAGDENDNGTTDLSCSIEEGSWKIRASGGTSRSKIVIEGLNYKFFRDIDDEKPSGTESADPVERLEISDRAITKSEFPIKSSRWMYWWDENLDGFRIERNFEYRTRNGNEGTVKMVLICEPQAMTTK